MHKDKSLIKEALLEEKVTIILKAWHKLPTKESKKSIEVREEGNRLFKERHHNSQVHEKIWKCYSQSVAKAPVASEDLALAYNNRSVLLLHIEKFRDSIKDIDRALEITQSMSLKVKLLCRKSICLSALGMNGTEMFIDQAMGWFNKIEQIDKKLMKVVHKAIDFAKKKDISTDLMKTSISNKKIFCIEDTLKEKESIDPFKSVSLKYNEKYGRHLIANKNMKPGEIVSVVRPYVTALNLNNFYAFCGHCLKTSWASIPCDYCSWCMFCSEKCKSEAWEKYHDIECQVIPYIQFNQTSDYWKQLSLKLTVMAIREAGNIEKLKEELNKIDKKNEFQKVFVNGKFQQNCFQSIYSLSSNVSDNALNVHVDHAVLTLIILAKSTTIFGENTRFNSNKDLLSNEDVLFIGSLILKFLKISDINAHSVMEGSSGCRFSKSIKKCQENRCCERGACLATVPSFINHSCYPTVRKCFTEDMQLVVFTLQPIKKYSQLFDCYIESCFDNSYSEREMLLHQFNFKCDCLPCQEKWQTIISPYEHQKYFGDNSNFDTEAQLLEKYHDLINCTDSKIFSLDALDALSIAIEKAKTKLCEPSYAIAILISTLWTIFDNLYGFKLNVTDKCNRKMSI